MEKLLPQFMKPQRIDANTEFVYDIGPFQPGEYEITEIVALLSVRNFFSLETIYISCGASSQKLSRTSLTTISDFEAKIYRKLIPSAVVFDSVSSGSNQTAPFFYRFPVNFVVTFPDTYISFMVLNTNTQDVTGFFAVSINELRK